MFSRSRRNGVPEWFFYARQDFTGAGPTIVERDVQSDHERIVFRGNPRIADSFRSFRFSPDRRFLAINQFRTRDDLNQQGIVVVDVETGRTPVVYDNAADETFPIGSPAWSPNGRAVLVQARTKQTTELRLIPIDGTEVRRIPLVAENTPALAEPRRTDADH